MKRVFKTAILLSLLVPSLVLAASELVTATPETVEGAETVNSSQARALFDQEAAFIDLRKEAMWNSGRIPGAIWLDFKNGFTKDALGAEVGADEKVVFYCSGVRCPRSSKGAIKAVEWGYKYVYYYRDGFPSWKQAGYPVE